MKLRVVLGPLPFGHVHTNPRARFTPDPALREQMHAAIRKLRAKEAEANG